MAKQQISQTAIHPPRPADQVQGFSSNISRCVSFFDAITPLTAKIVIRSTGAAGFLHKQSSADR
jgi:hypothetical protein